MIELPAVVTEAARWGGLGVSGDAGERLRRYHDWLRDEAIPAGGLAPDEGDRLWSRHIADSLTFAIGWRHLGDPEVVLDVGSGVGLPGIPLAITLSGTRFTLLDRSGRRCRLIRRAVRVLAITNVSVEQADVGAWVDPMPAVVSRAAMPPASLRPHLERIVGPGGVAVLGGSHVGPVPEPGFELVRIPPTVLDHEAWLRIMARP